MDDKRVLVVDDDEPIRNLMVFHLRRRGFEVDGAVNGVEGLEALRARGPFAVLVTDLMMPKMNGLDLLRQARALDPYLVVIVVTAAATLDTAIAALREDGAYDYLTKPLETVGALSVAVERALAHRQLQLERDRLHAQLAAEAERLQLLIANIGDAILAADAAGRLTVANPAAMALLSRDDLIGADALAALPEPLASVAANWHTSADRQPAAIEVAWPVGSTQLVNLSPMRGDAAGGWVMAVRDITHLKQLDDLKMRMLTETASKLQLPLAQAMSSLSELDVLGLLNGGRAADAVHRLTGVWRRIQDWTDEVLTLARYESGAGLQMENVNVAAIVNETARNLTTGPRLRAKDLKLDVSLADDLPMVYADPDLLRKMLHGLISRAALRSQPGGLVRLRARQEAGQVRLEVSDDGPPIRESDLPHLFDKSLVESSMGYASAGLELAMVKTIVDQAGGQVWVRGNQVVGSAIAVCLPAVIAAPRPMKVVERVAG